MAKSKEKKKSIVKPLVGLLTILVISVALIPLLFKNLKFGLDLQGGFEVLYSISSLDEKEVTSDMVTSTYKTMLKRIDSLGVSEPVITIEGSDKIRVQLAGVTNPEEARNLLSSAANLTFRDTSNNLLMTSEVLKSGGARVGQDSNGNPAVSLAVKDKDTFYKVTKKLSESDNNTMVVWLDFDEGVDTYMEGGCGVSSSSGCLSAATVSQGFASDVIIQGNFTKEEVEDLVDLINSGSLSTKLTELSSKTVGASFGANSLEKTLIAGSIGIALIIIFMIATYRFSGLVASITLMLYTLLTFSIFWVLGGVLTLPGIAAAIIGIGMAVDSNVINFSRIKDELIFGKSFKNACRLGNKESLSSIIDGNITTLIVAVILFIFGESSIKGFATMLIISTIVTLFVMVFVARKILNKFVETGYFDNKPNAFIGLSEKRIQKEKKVKNINFISKSNIFVVISIVIIVVGIISLFKQGMNLGIDFRGGSSISLQVEKTIGEDQLKQDIKDLGLQLESLEYIDNENITMVVDNQMTKDEVLKTETYFEEKYNAQTDIGVVSNIVKRELIKNAIYSLLLSTIGIIIYVSLRFKFSYAVSGLVALLHDVFIIISIFSVCHLEVSTIFIAAILSIIGYSVNDTIVVFDRIRENIKDKKIKVKDDLKEVVNLSLKQTIMRSLITTLTTLFPVVCLILFGSNEIVNFNIALLIGLVVGSYSSLFIASKLWIYLEAKSLNKPIKKENTKKKEPEELLVKGINA